MVTPAPVPYGNRHLAALDGVRGFAVLLVFCVHAAGNAAHLFLGIDFDTAQARTMATFGERLLFWLYRSHHGVFLFFVLSGFLIARLWWPHPRWSYRAFVWRRTLRIYPAFLLAFVASLAFALASGNWRPPDWPRVLGNLFFLDGWPGSGVPAFNIVTWSLFYEVTFYLVFPLALLALLAVLPPRAGCYPSPGLACRCLPHVPVAAISTCAGRCCSAAPRSRCMNSASVRGSAAFRDTS